MSAYGNAAVAQSVERRLARRRSRVLIPVSKYFCKNESWHIFLADMGIGADFLHFHGCTMLGDRVYCYRSKCFDLQ